MKLNTKVMKRLDKVADLQKPNRKQRRFMDHASKKLGVQQEQPDVSPAGEPC